jgi:hypothetical protein
MHRRPGQQALFCRHGAVDEDTGVPPVPPVPTARQQRQVPAVPDHEEEASAFAAALLMPRWLFVREHARCAGDITTLCETFGTSRAATERRAKTLFAQDVGG